jgi:hypothetical protein
MNHSPSLISEILKSTFLTITSFTFFDLFIQGYSDYHNWMLPLLTSIATSYYLVTKYRLILSK